MTVILVDRGDDQHDLQINWWNWRPILALLRQANLIDDEQFERMGANGCGGELSAEEALDAAIFLKSQILPLLQDNEQVHVDGNVSLSPTEWQPISSTPDYELYATRKSCLEDFIAFCESSRGFVVY